MDRSPVFIDASGWIAIISSDDRNHESAKLAYQQLISQKKRIITTNWTLYEALSIIKDKIGHAQALSLWNLVKQFPLITLIKITDDIETKGINLFFRYRDKTWGVVDCASLIVMEQTGCLKALAYDRHFREASLQRGFEVIG